MPNSLSILFRFLVLLAGIAGGIFAQSPDAGPPSATATVEGDVVNDSTGKGVLDARVKLSGGEYSAFTSTDSEGHFRFEGLRPGYYQVRAEKPGLIMPGESPNSFSGGVGVSLLRPADQKSVQANVRLVPASLIAGKVTDEHGVPVADSMIELLKVAPIDDKRPVLPFADRRTSDGSHRLETAASVRTNDLGEYRVARLQAGTYFLFVRPGWEYQNSDKTYRDTYYPHSLDSSSATALDVAAGRELKGINIQIVKTGGVKVAGRLVKPAGDGSLQARFVYTNVSLSPQVGASGSATVPFAMTTDDRFELKDVLPGRYFLEALTRATNNPMDQREQKEVLGARQALEVGSADIDGITVSLQPLRDIRGVVAFEEGCRPEQGALIVTADGFSRLKGSSTHANVNADNSFVLGGLMPGRYTLGVQLQSGAFVGRPVSAMLGGVDVLKTGFEVAGERQDPLRIQMSCVSAQRQSAVGFVTGRVVDDAKRAVSGVEILLVSNADSSGGSAQCRARGRSNAAGIFSIMASPSEYRVLACVAEPRDGNWDNTKFLESCHKVPGSVSVTARARVRVDFTLPAGQRRVAQ